MEVAGMSLYNSENNEKKQMASLQWLVLNSGPLHALYLLGSAWRRASWTNYREDTLIGWPAAAVLLAGGLGKEQHQATEEAAMLCKHRDTSRLSTMPPRRAACTRAHAHAPLTSCFISHRTGFGKKFLIWPADWGFEPEGSYQRLISHCCWSHLSAFGWEGKSHSSGLFSSLDFDRNFAPLSRRAGPGEAVPGIRALQGPFLRG